MSSYRKELLVETHLHLAQQLETEGNFKLAERHYVEANDWGSAVNMYRANDLWDEAIRVAQRHGGPAASKKVSYAWAVSLGGEAGAKLLTKFGLIEQAPAFVFIKIKQPYPTAFCYKGSGDSQPNPLRRACHKYTFHTIDSLIRCFCVAVRCRELCYCKLPHTRYPKDCSHYQAKYTRSVEPIMTTI